MIFYHILGRETGILKLWKGGKESTRLRNFDTLDTRKGSSISNVRHAPKGSGVHIAVTSKLRHTRLLWTDNVANRKISRVFYPIQHCEILITLQQLSQINCRPVYILVAGFIYLTFLYVSCRPVCNVIYCVYPAYYAAILVKSINQ